MRISAHGATSNAGFTLLELLVVLTVIGLLSAGGAVMFAGSDQRILNQQVDMAIGFINSARRGAQTSGEVWEIRIEASGLSIHGQRLSPRWRGKAAIRQLSGEGLGAMRFYPDGSASGAALELSRNQYARHIEVDWQGRVDEHD